MYRLSAALVLLVFLMAGTAHARHVVIEIPLDHWNYECIEYMIDHGYLPPVFVDQFDRNEILTEMDMQLYAVVLKQVFEIGQPASITRPEWIEAFNYARQFVEEHHLTLRGDPNQEVPRHHWSYDALDILGPMGVLEGYPEGETADGKTMKRRDFALIVVKLLDSPVVINHEEPIVTVLAEVLWNEYSDQITIL